MASEVDICNRAMQKLGAQRILSLSDATPQARECNLAYPIVRDQELRKHFWNFAIKRVVLAPSSTAPTFGLDYSFPLPADFIKLMISKEPIDRDWVIEGRNLLTSSGNSLEIRYIAKITDTTLFDPLFVETLASAIAVETVEAITQSNTKAAKLGNQYDKAISDAKKADAIEIPSEDPPEDDWILARF